jgi:hypothetical protein
MVNFLQMILSAKNPREMIINLMNTNPQFQQALQSLHNSGGGASFEQMARTIAQQKGISEQELLNLFNSINR